MSRFEFCSAVLRLLGGKWPYGGALAETSAKYDAHKTPEEATAEIKKRGEQKGKHHAR